MRCSFVTNVSTTQIVEIVSPFVDERSESFTFRTHAFVLGLINPNSFFELNFREAIPSKREFLSVS